MRNGAILARVRGTMNGNLRGSLLAIASLLGGAACSDTVTGTPALPDAGMTPSDGGTVSPDAGMTPSDGGTVSPDSGMTPGDGGATGSLVGRWRVVGWDYTGPAGRRIVLNDRNTPVTDPMTGMPTPLRTNGVFFLSPTRMSWAFGTLAGDHFYAYAAPTPEDTGYSATGTTAPGLLDDATNTFTVAGGAPEFRFTRNADGTISLAYMGVGESSRTTLARAPTSPTRTNLNATGVAQLAPVTGMRPLLHPRFALLWDRAGAAGPLETNGAALTFGPQGYAVYFVVQAGAPPAEAQSTAYGVPVATAFTFVYDDRDDNGRYDAATDETRGLGPLVVAWRGEGTPAASFAESPVADLQPGWQIAHLHRDYGTGGSAVVPYDTTVMVNPDTPVSADVLRGALPRLVR